MKLKKWIGLFFGVLIACVGLFAACNAVVDPFGVFGDHVFQWYAYDMTQNPRIAKITYLDQHYTDYDSYVIGSSKASSLSVPLLNQYTGDRYYNMTWYGGDLKDEAQLVDYIIAHYQVENIVLAIDPTGAVLYDEEEDNMKQSMHYKVDGSSPLPFYMQYLFCNPGYAADKIESYLQRGYLTTSASVYTAETGCYNKQLRDAVPIGALSTYLAFEGYVDALAPSGMPYLEEAVSAISHIKSACDQAGIQLTVIGVPISNTEFAAFSPADLSAFWTQIAQVTDFYDFWAPSSVTTDPRYFYDVSHFRNNAGAMALAYVFEDTSVYRPADFGHLTTASNVGTWLDTIYHTTQATSQHTTQIPILMYHSLTEDPAKLSDTSISVQSFADQLATLAAAGYETVDYQDLANYVLRGVPLPEKPILLSFDDGYANNLTLAAPLLQSYGGTATVAVIGCSAGKDTYKDTGSPMEPHFSLEDALPWMTSGTLSFVSHSYDMHQVTALDGDACRQGVLQQPEESESDYISALTADYLASKSQLDSALGTDCSVFVYPYGASSLLSEVVLHSLGVQVTVSTQDGVSELVQGIPQSLYQLARINVSGEVSGQDLLTRIASYTTNTTY